MMSLCMQVEKLCNILGSDVIAAKDEAEVYTAANRWINYNTEGRKQ